MKYQWIGKNGIVFIIKIFKQVYKKYLVNLKSMNGNKNTAYLTTDCLNFKYILYVPLLNYNLLK